VTDTPPDDPAAMADRLYEHLHATAERPVERHASRVLGEAEAVADDMRGCDPPVLADRAAVVAELLSEVDGTEDDVADSHLTRARDLADTLARYVE